MWVKYVLPVIAGAVLVAGFVWFVKRNLRDLIDVLFDSLDESDDDLLHDTLYRVRIHGHWVEDEPEKPEREGDNHE